MVARFINRDVCPPSLKNTAIALVLIFMPTLLVAAQPDLGTSILVALSGLFVLFLSGLSWRLIGVAVVLVAAFIPILWFFLMHDYQRQRVMMLPTRNQTHSAQAITLFSLKLLLAPADYAAKAGCTALSHSLNFSRTPYRLYLRGTGGRAGISGHFDSARSLHSADHARAVDSRQSANHLWSRHGWRLNADIIRLCLRKYWYGKRYSAGCRVPLPLVSYGGSALIVLMAGFGIVMSIHTHRKMLSKSV